MIFTGELPMTTTITVSPPAFLYHGTSASSVRAILQNGLHPRGASKSQWEDFESRPEHVYLTSTHAGHFAMHSAYNEPVETAAAIFQIDMRALGTSHLYADEDFLEQSNRVTDKERMPTMEERTAYYRDCWQHMESARRWDLSLQSLGTCSHHGSISARFVSAVAILPFGARIWKLSEIDIDWRFVGFLAPYYRALSALPFDPEAVARERCDASPALDDHFDLLEDPEEVLSGVEVFKRPKRGWRSDGIISRVVAAASAGLSCEAWSTAAYAA